MILLIILEREQSGYITPTQSVLGMVAFGDMYWYAWDYPYYEKGMIPQEIFVPKGTILIDRTIVDSGEEERERFIVTHECFHYLLHPRCFRKSDGMGQYCRKESFNPWGRERKQMKSLNIRQITVQQHFKCREQRLGKHLSLLLK